MRDRVVRCGGWLVATMTASWLLWMTLRPNPQVAARLHPIASAAETHGLSAAFVIGTVGNVAVFVPLGMGLAVALKGRAGAATLIGAGLSLVIEGLQFLLPSRVSSLVDFVLNSMGVALGAFIVHLTLRKIWRHHD